MSKKREVTFPAAPKGGTVTHAILPHGEVIDMTKKSKAKVSAREFYDLIVTVRNDLRGSDRECLKNSAKELKRAVLIRSNSKLEQRRAAMLFWVDKTLK